MYVWHLLTVIIVTVNKNRYFLLDCFIFALFLLAFAKKLKILKNSEKFWLKIVKMCCGVEKKCCEGEKKNSLV
jgi:hypothetical protein